MAFGKILRQHREAQGLTLEQLAELSDVEVGTISALENRDSQRSKFAPQLARALGVPLEELLGFRPTTPQSYSKGARTTRLIAQESGLPTVGGWPLPGITPQQFYGSLSPSDRAAIVSLAKALLDRRPPAPAPADEPAPADA